ncbi:putative ABC transporter permease subunit [Clostridium sp. B9]|uniref:putative ABC transporter permease subunit n=1 Tax=Clostridium sp. B9 TaxID=3423224 RepID=UPI003D2F006C
MNNLLTLLKVNFINNLGLNTFLLKGQEHKEKKKAVSKTLIMILAPIAMIYVSAVYSFLLSDMLKEIGGMELLIILGIIGSAASVFITTIYKAQGNLFSLKDFDMLMSLPIKNSVIFASKLMDLLLLNWIFTTCFILPPALIYFNYSSGNIVAFLSILIISILFIPLIPVLLGSICAFIIAFIASRVKFKNLITTIGSMILFLGIFLISFKAQNLLNSLVQNSTGIIDLLSKVYPPAYFLSNALVQESYIELLKFIGVSLIPFIIFIYIFASQFEKINSKLGESYKKVEDYKVSNLEANGQLKALYLKELKGYFSIPIYILNTAFGMLLLIVGAVSIFFMDINTLGAFLGIKEVADKISLFVLGLSVFCIGLSATTPASISLEGKNIWIIKSLPIDERNIFMSKILVCLTITVPALIVTNILFTIGLKFSITTFILNLVVTLLFALVSAVTGLIINLNFINLEWSSPTVVVKQSASVFINMVFTFASIALGVILFLIFKGISIELYMVILAVILLVVLLIEKYFLIKNGREKLYSA